MAGNFFGGQFFGGGFFGSIGPTPTTSNPQGGGAQGGWHSALVARRKRQEREDAEVQMILQAIIPHIAAQTGNVVQIKLENDDD